MINIAFLGNCQVRIIQKVIMENMGKNIKFLEIPVIHTIMDNVEIKTEIFDKLNEMDYIITQPLSEKFTPLNLNSLKKLNQKLIVVPKRLVSIVVKGAVK